MTEREILFRGKAINREEGREYRTSYKNGDWVYGLVTKLYDERFENLPATMTNEYGISGIKVDHNTIGQYTGLTANGTKIFEGDILKIVDDEGNTDFSDGGVGNVEFAYGLWYVSGKPQNGLWDLLQAYYCEVIGNIYDNPELLEGAEK